jgi:ATP-dependent Clp protease protease subunit
MPLPKWLNIQNKTEDSAEIHIYGTITDEKWFEEDITPAEIRDKMTEIKNAKRVDVYINSGGGGVFAGNTIYNLIKRHTGEVVAHIDGIAASIASVIAMAAKKIIMPSNAMMMIHNPIGAAYGYPEDLRKTADILDKVKDSIVAAYAEKTGVADKKIRDMMDAETWMTAKDAKAIGFADEIATGKDIKACMAGEFAIINGLEIPVSSFRCFPKLPENKIERPDFSYYEKQLEFNNLLLSKESHICGL